MSPDATFGPAEGWERDGALPSAPLRLLVWQWGRRGAGPRYAAGLAASLDALPGAKAVLSLSVQAEIMQGPDPPACTLPFRTYDSLKGAVRRLLLSPLEVGPLAARLRALRLDAALCAMPAALDLVMAQALRRAGVPFAVVVHDADPHPGDRTPVQTLLQRALVRRADALVTLTPHVARRLGQQGWGRRTPLIEASLPPLIYGPPPPPPLAHGGPLRLLSFGRLLPYKGLDMLAEALRRLGPRPDVRVRVVGSGPDSPPLSELRALPNVTVENRWVPESEVAELLAWADALVLSYREASQSGVAAAAIAARRWLVATRVGGIAEQLGQEPLARLCEPEAASLAEALLHLLRAPPSFIPSPSPATLWEASSAALLRALAATLLGRARQPSPSSTSPVE